MTALHDLPAGIAWTTDAIAERKAMIEQDRTLGLRWSVVESVPVHERIKLAEGDTEPLYEAFRESLRNLGAAGIRTVCYNFMPVLDWARTQLRHPLPGGGSALRFNAEEFAAFDVYMLRRAGAEADWPAETLANARNWIDVATDDAQRRLLATIMAGLPGALRPLRHRWLAKHAGTVPGYRSCAPAKSSCALSGGGGADRRGGRGPARNPPG